MSKNKFTQADDIFRELLRETRIAKDLTQAELAARLGQPQSYVSKFEIGERRLDFVETLRVCEALGIGIEKFAKGFAARLNKNRRSPNG